MSDQEIEDFFNTFDTIPNPVHYPKSFARYVENYRFLKTLQGTQNESTGTTTEESQSI